MAMRVNAYVSSGAIIIDNILFSVHKNYLITKIKKLFLNIII